MSESPDVSVVVAAHNRADRLTELLAGLRAQELPGKHFEVIVVDDGSADATPEVLAAEQRRGALDLRFARQEPAGGPARARNRGWRMAKAPLIAFTDDDCVPTPGWLAALLAEAAGPDQIVQGRTLPRPDEAHLLDAFARTVHIEGPTPHFETCNILYGRSVLERIEGFDETYPSPAGEDSDLGWRAREAGAEVGFAPEAVVHHAVFSRPPLKALRDALQATDGVQAYKLNPSLRQHLVQGLFYDRSHPLLLQSALAAVIARRSPAALLFCAPYAMNIRARLRAAGGPATAAPWMVLFDAVQIAATVRGAVRHRYPVL